MTTEARPQALPVQAVNIPPELKERPHFVLWRYEYRDGNQNPWRKVPYQVNGQRASSTDPNTWAASEAALEALLAHSGRFDGIGFALSPNDSFVGVDLDHCRNPEDGNIELWAQDIVDRLDSCTEVTPSGTGLRIFVQGKLPPQGRKRGNFEVYESGRFLTITGHHLEGTSLRICERQAELEAIHREQFSQLQPSAPAPAPQPRDLRDSDILDRMFKSRNGDRVRPPMEWRLERLPLSERGRPGPLQYPRVLDWR
jgi:putative DNA primase/helicase